MARLEFIFQLIVTCCFAVHAVRSDVECFRCRNGPDCLEPTSSKTERHFCMDPNTCGTQTIYAKQNASTPYGKTPVKIERLCLTRQSYYCTREKGEQCQERVDEKMERYLYCHSCCDTERCNTDIPGQNSATKTCAPSIIVFVTILVAILEFSTR